MPAMVTEWELIEKLTANAHNQAEGLIRGGGDDCTVIAGTGTRDWLITIDSLYEHVHFRREYMSFRDLGRKALAVNVSDVAAMGGRPRFYLVSIGIPKAVSSKHIEELYAGMDAYAEQLGVVLIGGDTCATAHGLAITVTVIGDVPHGRSIYRRGAKVGDGIYVTGALGGSAVGLRVLEENRTGREWLPFIRKHLIPIPRLESATWLGATGCVSAMIDVSDGLLSDLGHICRTNKVGMELEALRIPIFPGLDDASRTLSFDSLSTALTSGEEYELAFTVSGFRESAFMNLLSAGLRSLPVNVTRIGKVVAGEGIRVVDPNGRPVSLESVGFAHQFSV